MKELSIFVDEFGDFGDYAEHSSYHIISMILHDQSIDITKDVYWLESKLADLGYPNHCMHSGLSSGMSRNIEKTHLITDVNY